MEEERITARIETVELTETYGQFRIEPLESGFGTTLGNALRRVLLSSLPGAAVVAVRIDQALHEFSTIPGMREDVRNFLLNVKGLRLRPLTSQPGYLYLDVQGPGVVTAADIRATADYEVVNPELYLATLDGPDARLSVEFRVAQGKGYQPAAQSDGMPIGVIPVDAIFSPIRKVNYWVERARVEQMVTYDRLQMEVWTDGTIGPEEALSQAAHILIEQLALFRDLGRRPVRLDRPSLMASIPAEAYQMPLEDLRLPLRTYNALRRHGLTRVGEVLEMSEDELLAVKNFGPKSLEELRERLAAVGLLGSEEEQRQERWERGAEAEVSGQREEP